MVAVIHTTWGSTVPLGVTGHPAAGGGTGSPWCRGGTGSPCLVASGWETHRPKWSQDASSAKSLQQTVNALCPVTFPGIKTDNLAEKGHSSSAFGPQQWVGGAEVLMSEMQ